MNCNVIGEWTLNTDLPVSFSIKNTPGLFSPENRVVLEHGTQGAGSRRLIAIDSKVADLYLRDIIHYFNHHEVETKVVVVNAVETNKNLDSLVYLLDEIEQFGLLRRDEPILGIGGGVLLDLVGFAASVYRRGVPYVRIPTTLLGLIDASVGAKTGINFNERRNRLGSYYPPVAAYLDKSFLKTLEMIEISSGLGEIIKMAVVKDARLYEILKNHGKQLYESKFLGCDFADEVINRSVKGMKDELETNLWEKDLKRYVDFGHSFSPIIEMRSLIDDNVPSLTHGQAVTLDVIFSSVISHLRGMMNESDVFDIIEVSRSVDLPVFHPYFGEPFLIFEALKDTMKHRNGDQNLPVPVSIGKSQFINDVTFDEIKKAAAAMKAFSERG